MSFDYSNMVTDLQNQIASASKKITLPGKAEGTTTPVASNLFAVNGLTNLLSGLLGNNSSFMSLMPTGGSNFNNPFAMMGGMTGSFSGLNNFFSPLGLPPAAVTGGISMPPLVMGSALFGGMMGMPSLEMFGIDVPSEVSGNVPKPKAISNTVVANTLIKKYDVGKGDFKVNFMKDPKDTSPVSNNKNSFIFDGTDEEKTKFMNGLTAKINNKVVMEERRDYKELAAEALGEEMVEHLKRKGLNTMSQNDKSRFINGIKKICSGEVGKIKNRIMDPEANFAINLANRYGISLSMRPVGIMFGIGGGYNNSLADIKHSALMQLTDDLAGLAKDYVVKKNTYKYSQK